MTNPTSPCANGPYHTWAQVHAVPAVRDTYALATAASSMSAENHSRLLAAVQDAGVELGAYDRDVLAWLAGWEPERVQVVIGLIRRAAAAGGRSCCPGLGSWLSGWACCPRANRLMRELRIGGPKASALLAELANGRGQPAGATGDPAAHRAAIATERRRAG